MDTHTNPLTTNDYEEDAMPEQIGGACCASGALTLIGGKPTKTKVPVDKLAVARKDRRKTGNPHKRNASRKRDQRAKKKAEHERRDSDAKSSAGDDDGKQAVSESESDEGTRDLATLLRAKSARSAPMPRPTHWIALTGSRTTEKLTKKGRRLAKVDVHMLPDWFDHHVRSRSRIRSDAAAVRHGR
jgi:hypothetical protein